MSERKDDRLWGGRFEREPNKQFDAFQRSFSFDRRLLPYELAVDRAWAQALQKAGVLTEVELRDTLAGIDSIANQLAGDLYFRPAYISIAAAAAAWWPRPRPPLASCRRRRRADGRSGSAFSGTPLRPRHPC